MTSLFDLLVPTRTITGKLVNPELFWTEVQRAQFLLSNLEEPELNWSMIGFYLNWVNRASRERNGELEVLQALYCAWISINDQIIQLSNFELDPWWLYKFRASGEHILERVYVFLKPSDQLKFELNLSTLHKAINSKILMGDLT